MRGALVFSLSELPEDLVVEAVELFASGGLEHDVERAITPNEVVLYVLLATKVSELSLVLWELVPEQADALI